jgi:hypothetical protein
MEAASALTFPTPTHLLTSSLLPPVSILFPSTPTAPHLPSPPPDTHIHSYDRCICSYDLEKLPTKPKEAFKRVRECARAGITSMSLDAANNLLLVGSLDGALRVWSMEGR